MFTFPLALKPFLLLTFRHHNLYLLLWHTHLEPPPASFSSSPATHLCCSLLLRDSLPRRAFQLLCKNQDLPTMFIRRIVAAYPRSRRMFSSSTSQDFASTILELNKEMESVFGEAPAAGLASSQSNIHVNNESQVFSQKMGKSSVGLTHTGHSGEAQMVDVSPKENSKRTAIAGCKVLLGKKVFDLVSANQMAKGDVLTVAKIAGITAAKQTSSLIPLCHNISLTHVQVDLRLNHEDFSVTIEGEAATTGKTGVEMEAMTAVSVAGLAVYDMCKAASKEIVISDIRLKHKSGGKSGDWSWGQ